MALRNFQNGEGKQNGDNREMQKLSSNQLHTVTIDHPNDRRSH